MSYLKHLNKDKVLKPVIGKVGQLQLEPKSNICLSLCASIISQQLSTKVATVIYERFLALLKSSNPKPASILALSHEGLRSIGLSNSKALYIKNVCQFFIDHKITDARLRKMSNDELIELLTQIKGVGRWTVEMLLIFTLGREDVYSMGDYGLQKAMIKLYNIEHQNPKELSVKIQIISQCWSPYRSYACRYLWRYLDME